MTGYPTLSPGTFADDWNAMEKHLDEMEPRRARRLRAAELLRAAARRFDGEAALLRDLYADLEESPPELRTLRRRARKLRARADRLERIAA